METIRKKIENVTRFLKQNTAEASAIDESNLSRYGLREIVLRPYQLEGIQWMIARYKTGLGCILADEMGLGKTCQTISFLLHLYGSERNILPSLILLPLSVTSNWKTELKRFAPEIKFICYIGGKEERIELRQKIKSKSRISIILTTYEICLKDEDFLSGLGWHTLVVDEGHRLKNRQSQLHQALRNFNIVHRILLTGTPVQNNLDELYSLLSFVQPDIFRLKYADEFIETYKDVISCSDSDISEILSPFVLRRIKSQVLEDLPKKSEVVLYHGLSSLQKKYYKAILTKDFEAFTSESGVNRTRLSNILMQLRKCVNHPYLFDGAEPEPFQMGEHLVEASGKLFVLDRLLHFLHQNDHKVLIFSQMTRVLDILQDYMALRGYSYERLDGSVRAEERFVAVQNFNEDETTFAFLLSTKAGGQGLNLTAADTVIFVDSDFNPQNDLQAAARAHRIGQLRNVKVIRLIGRSTVEEIILKRAEDKLRLTEAVIVAGQSTSATGVKGYSDELKIEDILKFGLDKLFENDDSSVDNIDFASILGASVNGSWQTDSAVVEDAKAMATSDDDDAEQKPDNYYIFEGKDYSKEPSAGDLKVFQQLIDEEKAQVLVAVEAGRALRNKRGELKLTAGLPLDMPTRKPRKSLTPEELEERRKKREERAAIRAKEAEEEEIRREQDKRKRREEIWKKNQYQSCNFEIPSEDSDDSQSPLNERDKEEDEEEEEEEATVHYVVGDVTHPQCTNDNSAIVVHVLDDSGVWGSGGVFTSLSNRSPQPEQQYTMAGKMKDLALGDVHIIGIDDIQSRSKGRDWLALIIAQKRDSRNNLSGIKMTALQLAFRKLSAYAKANKASVHLPRIGYNTVGFNWYGTERLIRKYFAAKHIPTYIYYFSRKKLSQKRKCDAAEERKKKKHFAQDLTTSTSKSVVKDLPNFMHGVVAYFHKVPEELKNKFTRYVIAFDGDVQTNVNLSTTHIVTDANKESIDAFLKEHQINSDTKIVKLEWISESLKKQYIVDVDQYLLL